MACSWWPIYTFMMKMTEHGLFLVNYIYLHDKTWPNMASCSWTIYTSMEKMTWHGIFFVIYIYIHDKNYPTCMASSSWTFIELLLSWWWNGILLYFQRFLAAFWTCPLETVFFHVRPCFWNFIVICTLLVADWASAWPCHLRLFGTWFDSSIPRQRSCVVLLREIS